MVGRSVQEARNYAVRTVGGLPNSVHIRDPKHTVFEVVHVVEQMKVLLNGKLMNTVRAYRIGGVIFRNGQALRVPIDIPARGDKNYPRDTGISRYFEQFQGRQHV